MLQALKLAVHPRRDAGDPGRSPMARRVYTEGTDLWQKLGATRPVVFTVHVGGHNDAALTTHLMQDWAAAGGGPYQYAASHGQIDRAFDRMATWLRRPARVRAVLQRQRTRTCRPAACG